MLPTLPMLKVWLWFCIRDNHFTGIFTSIAFREKRVAFYFRIYAVLVSASISAYVAARMDVSRVNACTQGSSGYNLDDCKTYRNKAMSQAVGMIGQWLLADLMIIIARFMERRLSKEKQHHKTGMNLTALKVFALLAPAIFAIACIYLTVRAYNGGVAMGDEEKKEEEYFKRSGGSQFGGSTSSVLHGGTRAPGVQYIKPEKAFSAGELIVRMILSWVFKAALSFVSVVRKSFSKDEGEKMRTVEDVQAYFNRTDDQITPMGLCDSCCWSFCCCGGTLPITAPAEQQPQAPASPKQAQPPGPAPQHPMTPPLQAPPPTYGNFHSPNQYPQQFPQQYPQQHPQQYPQQCPQQYLQQHTQQYPQQYLQQHPQQYPQIQHVDGRPYDQNQPQYYPPNPAAPGYPYKGTPPS